MGRAGGGCTAWARLGAIWGRICDGDGGVRGVRLAGGRIAHQLTVAVIGRDERDTAARERRIDDGADGAAAAATVDEIA